LFNIDNERRHQIKGRQKVTKHDGQRKLKVGNKWSEKGTKWLKESLVKVILTALRNPVNKNLAQAFKLTQANV